MEVKMGVSQQASQQAKQASKPWVDQSRMHTYTHIHDAPRRLPRGRSTCAAAAARCPAPAGGWAGPCPRPAAHQTTAAGTDAAAAAAAAAPVAVTPRLLLLMVGGPP